VAILEPYWEKPEERIIPPVEADDEESVLEAIIASGSTYADNSKLVFLTKWIGFSKDKHTWECWWHLTDIAPNLIQECYGKNPSIENDMRCKQPHQQISRKRQIQCGKLKPYKTMRRLFLFYFHIWTEVMDTPIPNNHVICKRYLNGSYWTHFLCWNICWGHQNYGGR
jgi:hypothetical protein